MFVLRSSLCSYFTRVPTVKLYGTKLIRLTKRRRRRPPTTRDTRRNIQTILGTSIQNVKLRFNTKYNLMTPTLTTNRISLRVNMSTIMFQIQTFIKIRFNIRRISRRHITIRFNTTRQRNIRIANRRRNSNHIRILIRTLVRNRILRDVTSRGIPPSGETPALSPRGQSKEKNTFSICEFAISR